MEHAKSKDIMIIVSGEEVLMSSHKVTVGAILTEAGFVPLENYRLVRDAGDHKYPDYAEEIEIHERERFTALFEGQTQTS
ncbi:hypothetical protein [Sulfoacidibacillus ferrooxidans]|uniref:Uncharacterized protein n=1 Tax=Sulfoacidibacillus ferrooxidans TaxID=2005001 RepID=A0A9X1VB66_9BACL|nr:hypothetical protein [Sulfoacidibacillus ferrooxidans]MCI0184818.1 hypothetical protein [Sulfoacidibacillus ferrooxidans]